MKVKRKIIQIDQERCDGCGNCIPSCAEGAIQIVDGVAKIVKDEYCDGLGACLGECPQDALKIVEREAKEFDEEAVETYLKELEKQNKKTENKEEKTDNLACGCPSSQIQVFSKPSPCSSSKISTCSCSDDQNFLNTEETSSLGHWPVKIKLIPPSAPFLKNAELLVLADCVPAAYSSLHSDFMKDKVVMMGCPKFDDVQFYIEKFAQIFKINQIKSVTTLIMEVPCCSGLAGILKKAMELSDIELDIKNIVISTKGQVLKKNNVGFDPFES